MALVTPAGAQSGARPSLLAVDPPEIRGLWVDAFHAGIRSSQEVGALVAAALEANINTLFVRVRRRGDVLYLRGIEPPLDDPAYDPAFDALAAIIDRAHATGLEVHAWVNAMPTWRDELPPRDARHVFNRQGPAAPGADNWFTAAVITAWGAWTSSDSSAEQSPQQNPLQLGAALQMAAVLCSSISPARPGESPAS